MVHRLHNSGLIFENFLRPCRQPFLGNDLQCGLFFSLSILDHQDDPKRTHAKQIAHTKHLRETVQLLSLRLSIFLQKGMRESLVVLNADFSHQHIVAISRVGRAVLQHHRWLEVLLPSRTAILTVLFRALLPKHAKTVDIEALLEYFLDLLALQPFLLLDLRFALRRRRLLLVLSER